MADIAKSDGDVGPAAEEAEGVAAPAAEEEVGNSLCLLLKKCLSDLNQEDRLESTLAALNKEWFFERSDLLVLVSDVDAWAELKLPGRLKLAIKRELLGSGSSSSSSSAGPTPASSKKPHLTPLNTSPAQEDIDASTSAWTKCFSPEHNSFYYFNDLTEETVWTLPEGAVAKDDAWSMQLAQGMGGGADGEVEREVDEDEAREAGESAWQRFSNEAEQHSRLRRQDWPATSHEYSSPPVPSAPPPYSYDPSSCEVDGSFLGGRGVGSVRCVSAFAALPVAVVVSAEAEYEYDDGEDDDDDYDEGEVEDSEEGEGEEESELEEEDEEEGSDAGEHDFAGRAAAATTSAQEWEESKVGEGRGAVSGLWGDEPHDSTGGADLDPDAFFRAWSDNEVHVHVSPPNVRRLVEMGFSEEDSLRALKCCNDGLSDAAALLVTRSTNAAKPLPPAKPARTPFATPPSSASPGLSRTSLERQRLEDASTINPPASDVPPLRTGLFPRLSSKVRSILSRKTP